MSEALQRHSEQIEYWNGAGGARWIANQARRDTMLGGFAVAALARADVQPGERVIDIGCGCGETGAELAERVGAAGQVLAVDVSAPILAIARDRLAPYPWARAAVADAAAYPFEPGKTDVLFSRFGVMFFGDPPAAFANLRRALRPGGRLVFVCWRAPSENPWMTAPLETVFKFVPRPPPADPDAPGPFAFANQARVAQILTQAGFAPPTFEKLDPLVDISGGAGVSGAVQTALEFGPTARVLQDQPDDIKIKVSAAIQDFLSPFEADGALKLPSAVWIVSTTNPAD